MSASLPSGLLLPEAVLYSDWFAVWATFVAINTLMYAALSVAKILPKIYPSDLTHRRNRRTETRGIYPDAETGRSE
ncbi:hypothetical protein [Leifsonia sp. Root4]|uniref:hypothetical protein n=1 Tax=Leifsonia sp. Root4 TaxID=1736525 RepID=UPI000B2824AC|nr:hypothetical protein [Leifsonia sp. Root4]